jgi:4-amino-4-deoxy-L-arabinose transferase-like glycosyltransferase
LFAVAVLALAVRVAYALARRDTPVGGDSLFYHLGAYQLVEGMGFVEPVMVLGGVIEQSANHPPLYLLYLAVPTVFGLNSALAHMLWSGLLGTASVVLIGLIGRKVAGPRAGLIAAGIGALYPGMWVYDGFILSETMAIFTAMLTTLLAYCFLERPSRARAAALGFSCGLAALARAELSLLVPLVVLPCVWITRSSDAREAAKRLVIAGVAVVMAVGPWVGFNLARFEHPVLLSTGFEPTILGTNCDETYYGRLFGYFSIACERPARIQYKPDDDQSERNAISRRVAFDYIGDHLDRVPAVVLARWGRVTGLYRVRQQLDLDQNVEGRERGVARAVLGSFYVVAALAIAGAVILHRRRATMFPLVALPVTVMCAVALALGSNRYRASAEGALVVLAAVAVDALLRTIGDRRRAESTQATAPTQPAAQLVPD